MQEWENPGEFAGELRELYTRVDVDFWRNTLEWEALKCYYRKLCIRAEMR